MVHPLVLQLRFTRSEFTRGVAGLNNDEAQRRFLPMNCISWSIGHLAWQEQRYFVTFAQGKTPLPELNQQFAYGAPACTPRLDEMTALWQAATQATDEWLNSVTNETLLQIYTTPDGAWTTSFGNLMQRVIYHYWYHIGESQAIRQLLGHSDLPEFVGNIDDEAPYRAT